MQSMTDKKREYEAACAAAAETLTARGAERCRCGASGGEAARAKQMR